MVREIATFMPRSQCLVSKSELSNDAPPEQSIQLLFGQFKILEPFDSHVPALVKALTHQKKSGAIEAQCFEQLSILAQENEEITFKQVLLHLLANDVRKLFKTTPHIDVLREDKHAVPGSEFDAHRPSPRHNSINASVRRPSTWMPFGNLTMMTGPGESG